MVPRGAWLGWHTPLTQESGEVHAVFALLPQAVPSGRLVSLLHVPLPLHRPPILHSPDAVPHAVPAGWKFVTQKPFRHESGKSQAVLDADPQAEPLGFGVADEHPPKPLHTGGF